MIISRSLVTFIGLTTIAVVITGGVTSSTASLPQPQPSSAGSELSHEELNCLAKNVYFESKNQSIAGQTAVALVTLNRTNDPRFPSTICGVVQQTSLEPSKKAPKRACQFSWYCSGKSNYPNTRSQAWEVAMKVAMDSYRMHRNGFDFTNGATHFHATYVRPYWAGTLKQVARIDDHVFYKWT